MALNNNETFLTPNYMTSFKCIGKDCIDTCCNGLHIEIDKETYENYINSSDKKINSISKKYISKNNYRKCAVHSNIQLMTFTP